MLGSRNNVNPESSNNGLIVKIIGAMLVQSTLSEGPGRGSPSLGGIALNGLTFQGGNGSWEDLIPIWNGIGPLFQSLPGPAVVNETPNVEIGRGLSKSGGIPFLHPLSPCNQGFDQAQNHNQLGQPTLLSLQGPHKA